MYIILTVINEEMFYFVKLFKKMLLSVPLNTFTEITTA